MPRRRARARSPRLVPLLLVGALAVPAALATPAAAAPETRASSSAAASNPRTPGWGDGMTVAGRSCLAATRWKEVLRPSSAQRLAVRLSDPDGDAVRARLEIWDAWPRQRVSARTVPGGSTHVASGSTVSAGLSPTLTDGQHTARWRVQDATGAWSGWSPECPFTVLRSASISGSARHGSVVPVHSSQTWTITAPRTDREVAYRWRVNGIVGPWTTAPYPGRPITLTRPVDASLVELQARAVDTAGVTHPDTAWFALHGRLSDVSAAYAMRPVRTTTGYRVDNEVEGGPALTTAARTDGSAPMERVVRPARGVPTDSLTDALAPRATTGASARTGLDASTGFTVSAWLRAAGADDQTALVVPVTTAAGAGTLSVRRDATVDRYEAVLRGPGGSELARVVDAAPDQPSRAGRWWSVGITYLPGATGGPQLRLDVMHESDERSIGSTLRTSSSPVPVLGDVGDLLVGAGYGQAGWAGHVDDVRTWGGPATQAQVVAAAGSSW
ncbi:LamG-like jellyroll fold domain-containing protein [Janibacter melonis]|uniref:LamG-like jellyroll fold domain-containing protein n=1 Tax=Janibacter melonis TaxID=262209 RepID=UPI001748FC5D|nr:LamG-like jellyroll fold domain-containing protein [Janibacter melonis]